MAYELTPAQLAEHHRRFITELGVQVVGGCCGTGPDHIRRVVEVCRDLTPAPRTPVHEPGATSCPCDEVGDVAVCDHAVFTQIHVHRR